MGVDWPLVRILSIVPAPPGWTVYVLFRGAADHVAAFAAAFPVAAWGDVERQVMERLGRDQIPMPCGLSRHWEPLIIHDVEWGALCPADDLRNATNYVQHEIAGPDTQPPTWFGPSDEAAEVRQRVIDKQDHEA